MVLDCQKITDGQDSEDIECNEINVSQDSCNNYLNGSSKNYLIGMKCYSQCSANCTCLLDDNKVISNCTGGHVTVTHVIYLSNEKLLSWGDSILHHIQPEAFLRFGSILQGLNLTNVSLQDLQHGVFAGLEELKYLYLDYNRLQWITSGAFENLVQLRILSLSNNMLTGIHIGMFRGLIGLELLYLQYNMIHNIEQVAFYELQQLQELHLYHNFLSSIDTGLFDDLEQLHTLNLHSNILSEIYCGQCHNLRSLNLINNSINVIQAYTFARLINLEWLSLATNNLSCLAPNTFGELRNLTNLHISDNIITTLYAVTFQNLTKLNSLSLDGNKLQFLARNIFHSLQQLRHLNLSFNNLHRIPTELFLSLRSLETLDLKGNPLLWIEKHALASLNESVQLLVTDFATCCFTSAHCISSPPLSPYITCKRLLPYELLRIAMWFVCGFAVLGNSFAFYSRVKKKRQRHKVQTFLITNLAISDFLMGLYLISLLSADLYYKDYFPSHSEGWRSSILCRITGAISVLSSEASVFFITLITIDRFFGVKFTFSKFRLGTKSARIVVALIWTIAFSIAITVFILSQKDSDFYAVSEVCVGLPISRKSIHTTKETTKIFLFGTHFLKYTVSNYSKTSSGIGMFFSIALFTGFNLICFFIIGYCYFAIFIYVRQTTKQSGRSPNLNEEIRMTMKMFLLVFTDFCCWVPIGILSIFVQAGVLEVDPVAYAWIATFVLPINSSMNPFLYTLASFISDKVKVLRKETSQKKTEEECVPMR